MCKGGSLVLLAQQRNDFIEGNVMLETPALVRVDAGREDVVAPLYVVVNDTFAHLFFDGTILQYPRPSNELWMSTL